MKIGEHPSCRQLPLCPSCKFCGGHAPNTFRPQEPMGGRDRQETGKEPRDEATGYSGGGHDSCHSQFERVAVKRSLSLSSVNNGESFDLDVVFITCTFILSTSTFY